METLPAEILQCVAFHLPTHSQLMLRQTCRTAWLALPLDDLAHTWDAASLTRYVHCMVASPNNGEHQNVPHHGLLTNVKQVIAMEDQRHAVVRIVHRLMLHGRTPLAWWVACVANCADMFTAGQPDVLNIGATPHCLAAAVQRAVAQPGPWPDAAGMDELVCNFWDASQQCAQGVLLSDVVAEMRAQIDQLDNISTLVGSMLGMAMLVLPLITTFLRALPDGISKQFDTTRPVAHALATLANSVRLLAPSIRVYMEGNERHKNAIDKSTLGLLVESSHHTSLQLAALWCYRHLRNLPLVCDVDQLLRSKERCMRVLCAPPSMAALAQLVNPASAMLNLDDADTHLDMPVLGRARRVLRPPSTTLPDDRDAVKLWLFSRIQSDVEQPR